MPAWSFRTQTALAAGDNIQCLFNGETIAAGAGLKGFSMTPQATTIQLGIFNNSGVELALQASMDGVLWLPVFINGIAINTGTGAAETFGPLASGMLYRLYSAVAITGGTAWVTR